MFSNIMSSNNLSRKVNRLVMTALAVLFTATSALAQRPEVEMADTFRRDGKIYVVVAVALIIFLGMIVYLISIERKVKKLEAESAGKEK